jgi:hypothetical protein
LAEPKRFSDFSEEAKPLEGEKIKLEGILDKEIMIMAYRTGKSKFHNDQTYLTIQISINDTVHVVFTGSKVLESQLAKYSSELPFVATVKKINNYYTLT